MTSPVAALARVRPLTIATRGSALARAQTGLVRDRLSAALGRDVTIVEVATLGDTDRRALTSIGGTGVFATALREALLAGRADLAVHSLKDLPTAAADGLVTAAVPPRADPFDVLVSAGSVPLAALPAGAGVGTGSPRRAAQLTALRPDLDVVAVRGNVDTRVGKVRSGALDGVVLARAGLARLGRTAEIAHTFSAAEMLPAPGQGALAVECRAGEVQLASDLAGVLDDTPTRVCVAAERAVLATLEAGCSAPVGALATVDGVDLHLEAVVGKDLRHRASAPYDGTESTARALGENLARSLLERGAAAVMTDLAGLRNPDGTGRW